MAERDAFWAQIGCFLFVPPKTNLVVLRLGLLLLKGLASKTSPAKAVFAGVLHHYSSVSVLFLHVDMHGP